MRTTQLNDRALITISGPEAEHFLQNILTTDLSNLAAGELKAGALLTPQGKILFDFLISRKGESDFIIDCRSDVADDFARRLIMYKLRAKVEISKEIQGIVFVGWEDDSASSDIDSTALRDTRFVNQNVHRIYGEQIAANATPHDYTNLRIAHGIAESESDYALSDAFPHDVLLDEVDGVGFKKGCYVGQEVVSRMQHRGTARRRVMLVEGSTDLPASGAEIQANGRAIGTLGSVSGKHGLAIMRTDRVKTALDSGIDILADGVPVTVSIPSWAHYTLPQNAKDDASGPA